VTQLGDIVVNITSQTPGLSQDGFGIALILANTTHTYKEYSSISEVEVDFLSSTTIYKMANAIFGQEIKPTKIAIAGINYTEENTITTETLTNVSGNTYSFANTYIKVGSITGLEDNGVPIPDSDIDNIDYLNGEITFLTAKTEPVTVDSYVTYLEATGFTTLLNTLVQDGKNFYVVLTEGNGYRLQQEVNTWILTQYKLYFIRTDVLPSVMPITFGERTAIYYHETADEFPDAAIVGACFPKNAGSVTFSRQILSGITANVLTGATITELTNNRYNTIIREYGSIVTNNGFLAENYYIDQIRDRDYIKFTMEENIARLLIDNDKIPYDDTGIAQVVSQVTSSLNQAFQNGVIASTANNQAKFSVDFLSRAEIATQYPQDIINRTLTTVTFSYVEAGAIEGATINGTVVIELP